MVGRVPPGAKGRLGHFGPIVARWPAHAGRYHDPVPDLEPSRHRHPLPRLVRYARSSRRTAIVAATFSILNRLFDLAPPFLIGIAVDVVVEREQSLLGRLGFPDVREQLWILAIATIVIWVLESVFEYAAKVLWRNLAQSLQHELRIDAYGTVQRLDLRYFEDRSTGGLMSILADDVNQLDPQIIGNEFDHVVIV